MNYETEPWYKLYIRESTEDKLLPVLNRALRDFLLRLAKSRNDGTVLGKTVNPGEDLARALGSSGPEAVTIAEYVGTMLEDGYLTHRKGRLWITNFVAAQEARSAGARRQKTYRENKKKSPTRDVTPVNASVTQEQTSHVTVASLVTSQEIRSEKRREETRREEPERAGEPAVVVSAVPGDDPGRETMCPADLETRLESAGTVAALAEKLAAPIESIRHEIQQFVGYWTIGKGAGQKRTGWPGKARQWVVEKHGKGELAAPGAVQHAARANRRGDPGDTPRPSPLLSAVFPAGGAR